MSYIRSTSNPESLYIWSNGEYATIMKGPDIIGNIPERTINGLINKYIDDNLPDNCEYEGAKISEEWISLNNSNHPMMVLSYEDWEVIMWDVTWYYIAHSNYEKH